MSVRVYRPRRRLRIDIVQLICVLALPAAILHAFPIKALAPQEKGVAPPERHPAACAFVTLDPEQEHKILAAAKSAWQVSADSVRRLRLDMFVEEIPEAPLGPVADIDIRTRTRSGAPQPDELYGPPTDFRAPAPTEITQDEEQPAPDAAFSKEELLKMK